MKIYAREEEDCFYMCTPVGHSLVGYGILAHRSELGIQTRWVMLINVVLISNLPDVDFLFGWAAGNPNQYHHLWTHSLAFVLITGGLYGLGYGLFTRKNGLRVGAVVSAVVFSHLVLDYFSKDTRVPQGMPVFWPVSHAFFLSPVSLFSDVYKASSNSAFLGSLLCWHNLWTLLLEVAVLMPFVAWWIIRHRKRSKPK